MKIDFPKELKNRAGTRGKNKTPLLQEVLVYLPAGQGFFDYRHLVWGYLSDCLPFSVTTRISANNQQFVKIYEYN